MTQMKFVPDYNQQREETGWLQNIVHVSSQPVNSKSWRKIKHDYSKNFIQDF